MDYSAALILLFGRILGSMVSYVKNILLIKGNKISKYSIMVIDSVIWGLLIPVMALFKGPLVLYVGVLIVATLVSTFLGEFITSRVLSQVYTMNIYMYTKDSRRFTEFLYAEDISFTEIPARFIEEERVIINLHANEKQRVKVYQALKLMGTAEPNMEIIETKVTGKIKTRTSK